MTEQDRERARAIVERAIQAGATAADLLWVEASSQTVRTRFKEIERLEHAQERRLGLRVFSGQRSAVVATSDLSPDSVERLIGEALALSRAAEPDEAAGLPAASDLCRGEPPELQLWDDEVDRMSVPETTALAREAEAAALSADPRIANSEGSECEVDRGERYYVTSDGFSAGYRATALSIATYPVARQNGAGPSQMQRDYWYDAARWRRKLASPESIGRTAASRAIRRLGSRRVPTQETPVVFDPETAASLLRHVTSAVSGPAIYRGSSFMIGRLGEPVAAPAVTVIDDGTLPGALGSRPFDGEGLPSRRTVVIRAGVLNSYLLDTYSARRLGLKSTGNAARGTGEGPSVSPTNFYLEPGDLAPERIVASLDRGLWVTKLIGFGVNLATGDFSQGAAGLWVEHGEPVFPVDEITIAGNLRQMLLGIEQIGNDLTLRGRVAAPTIRIHRMMIGGS